MKAGPKQISVFMPQLLAPLLNAPGADFARLRLDWPHIVGPTYASLMEPLKIVSWGGASRAQDSDHGARPSTKRCLWVRISSAAALTLHYAGPDIIERINQYFGKCIVNDIRFKHDQSAAHQASRNPQKKVARPLSAEEERAVSELVDSVENDELKRVLQSLGRAVYGAKNIEKT